MRLFLDNLEIKLRKYIFLPKINIFWMNSRCFKYKMRSKAVALLLYDLLNAILTLICLCWSISKKPALHQSCITTCVSASAGISVKNCPRSGLTPLCLGYACERLKSPMSPVKFY